MSCLIPPPPQLSIRSLPILPKLSINNSAFWGKFGKIEQFDKEFRTETATFANRKFIRLAALLLYILRRKRHRSTQRKKLYSRMSNVLLNSCILANYGLWKSSEIGQIVLLINRSQYVLYCWQITRTTFVLVFNDNVSSCIHWCIQLYCW
jgi:hypothetical protein